MSEPVYRFLRVLEYVGTRECVDAALRQRSVKGTSPNGWGGGIVIYEAVLADSPQRVELRFARDLVKSQLRVLTTDPADPWIAGYNKALTDLLDELPL